MPNVNCNTNLNYSQFNDLNMKIIRFSLMVFVVVLPFNLYGIDNFKESHESKIELEIENTDNTGISFLDSLKELHLPDFSFFKKDTSTYLISFESKFTSNCLSKVLDNNTMSFYETYDCDDATLFLGLLSKFGLREITSSAYVGDFAVSDTAAINNELKKKNVVTKLPSDLRFCWYDMSKKDSVALFLLKNSRIKEQLSSKEFTYLSTKMVEVRLPIEYDENDNPTKWIERNKYLISIDLDSIGTKKLNSLTERNIAKYVALSINDKIIFMGIVNLVIDVGQLEVSLKKKILIAFYQELLFHKYPNIKVKGLIYR